MPPLPQPPPPQSSPRKATIVIPSSPPLPPVLNAQLPLAGQKRFLDIDLSSDDIPVFSSDDLPPKEVFANPYHAYQSTPRTVKRQRSSTLHSISLKHRARRASLPSDHLDEDGLPSNSSLKSRLDSQYSEGDQYDEANTSMTTIRPPRSQDDLDSEDILSSEVNDDIYDTKANFIIQQAIEQGSHTIDLSDLSLEQVPSDISSLSSAISQPKDDISASNDVPPPVIPKSSAGLLRSSSGIDPTVSSPYTSLRPEIHIHLTSNSLTTLPPSLTGLTNVVGLYLRKNQLRSIPHHISSMTSLKEFSLGDNMLAYLPFAILDIPNIRFSDGVTLSPNPFFDFPFLENSSQFKAFNFKNIKSYFTILNMRDPCFNAMKSPNKLRPLKGSPFTPSTASEYSVNNFVASTPIYAFNDMGRLVTSPSCPSISEHLSYPSAWPTSSLTSPPAILPLLTSLQQKPTESAASTLVSKFPTLQELCLRKMATDTMYTTLSTSQREEIYSVLPAHLKRKVQEVLEHPDVALKKCSVCEGVYVTKGAEWIEFWYSEVRELSSALKNWEMEYVKPQAIDTTLEFMSRDIEDDDDDGNGSEKAEEARQVAVYLRGLFGSMGPGKAFLKCFLGKWWSVRIGSVVPLLRETCSWECAEDWMVARMKAEDELSGVE
ncbi:hypothetical protein ABW20_dc0108104 [Dactylellina cionopaga]|nr:hypothetical protein ABW20_dc0108104 [Dactylellina cionopaga]